MRKVTAAFLFWFVFGTPVEDNFISGNSDDHPEQGPRHRSISLDAKNLV